MPTTDSIIAELGLGTNDAATLERFSEELAADPLQADANIEKIMHSKEYNEPEHGKQRLYQGLLIASITAKERPTNGDNGMQPSLPSGIRTPDDLIDPAPAAANLEKVKLAIKTLSDFPDVADDDPDLVELREMEADLLQEIADTSLLGAALATKVARNDQLNKEAIEKFESEEKADFFKRELDSHHRTNTPPAKAQELTELAWSRYKSRN